MLDRYARIDLFRALSLFAYNISRRVAISREGLEAVVRAIRTTPAVRYELDLARY